MLELSGPDLLACGLSRQKLAYITDLALRFHSGTLQTKAIVCEPSQPLSCLMQQRLSTCQYHDVWSRPF